MTMAYFWVPPAWTPDRVALLKRRWIEGASASDIAHELGDITRNGVLGKIHRLKARDEELASVVRAPSGNTTPRPRKKRSHPWRPKPANAKAPIASVSIPVAPKPIWRPCSILELAEDRCRFACACDVGSSGFHFCGGPPVPGLPYCDAHCRMAYRPPSEVRT